MNRHKGIEMELFNSLYENTKNVTSPLDDSKKNYIIQTVPKLDTKGHEIIFFLIRMFNIQQTRDVTFVHPYDSKLLSDTDSQIEFNLERLPNHLQHMIFMFVGMHLSYLQHELSRP